MSFEQLHHMYVNGSLRGAIVDAPDLSSETRKVAKESRSEYFANCESSPFFGDQVDYIDLLADKEGVALPFVEVLNNDENNLSDVQVTGDCYSHAGRGMLDVTRANERISGIKTDFIGESATCLIYAGRKRGGEGMTAYEVLNALKAGVLIEDVYNSGNKTWDLTDYKKYWKLGAEEWIRNGIPQEILQAAAQHPIESTGIIESMEELRAGLFAGRAFACGSSNNPTQQRNEYGICGLQMRPIAHAMLICGVDTRKKYHKENLYVWDNSWPSNFYRGPEPIYAKEFGIKVPKCSYILTESDTWRAVKQKGTIVASSIKGFPVLQMRNFGTTGHI